MKKILLISCLLSLASNAQTSSSLGGFYTGLNVGGAIIEGSYNQTANTAGLPNTPQTGVFGHSSAKNAALGLFFGYNHICGKVYFGGEAFLDRVFGGDKEVANDINHKLRLTIKRNGLGFGLLGKVGYLVHQDIGLYAGIGFKSTSFTLKSSDYTPGQEDIASKSNRSVKLHLQIGAEGLASKNIGWRVSYGYTPGKKISATPSTKHTFGNPANNINPVINMKPNEHTVNLGIFYKF